ncbi:MAG: hypothetical protein NTV86_23655 [Planctomycetota bacterium]|nr:hypothetical protein [Planctomycetota bacterium]
MRYAVVAMAMVAVLALVGTTAMAQDGQPPAGARGGRGGGNPFAQLDLTAEQKTKVEGILKASREKADKAETPEAKREIRTAAMEDIKKNVLTEEQRTKFEAMQVARESGLPLSELALTAEQKAKVAELVKAAREKAAKAENPQARREIMAALREEIRKNVLTDEQRAKLATLPGPMERMVTGRLDRLGLSDDQKAKVKGILTAARAAAEKAEGMEAKRAVFTAAMDDIKKNVLTEEQRKKLEAMPARGGRGGRGGQGGPPATN